jgi:hypothetical protein
MQNSEQNSRLHSLEKKVWLLMLLCAVLVAALSTMIVQSSITRVKAAEDAKVLRIKGLIIEDEQGRARILLGAPFPAVQERLRKDEGGADLVFLDEQGHDRFRVGEVLPAEPGFHRMGSAYGATILDTQGNERGGMGFLSDGKNFNRAVIALDRPYNPSVPSDAWGAFVDDKSGFAGTVYMYQPESGRDQEGITLGTQGNKAFLSFKDRKNKERTTIGLTDNMPVLNVFNESGTLQENLLKSSKSDSSAQH